MNLARAGHLFLMAVVCAAPPRTLRGQMAGRHVELVGTVGAVGGASPVNIDGTAHLGWYGGLRLDGGIQGERVEVGVGFRVWEFAPTRTFGGHGLDGLISSEWRIGSGRRNSIRASIGAGFDDIDPGRGPYRENTGTSGFEWSLGFGHEVIAPSGALVALSADLVMPNTNGDVNGRRVPVVELGFGYRFRRYQSISMIPSREP